MKYSSRHVLTEIISDPLNYDATEKVGAGYGMVKYTISQWELIAAYV